MSYARGAGAVGAAIAMGVILVVFGWPKTIHDHAAEMGTPSQRRRHRVGRAVLLAMVAGFSAVAYWWWELSHDSWPYMVAFVIVTGVLTVLWSRWEHAFLEVLQGDSEYERRLRKRAFEVVLLAFCAWVLLHWWAARHGP